ncbi:MAG: hypothetical protein L6R42_006509 [Xanthoria sp. 1 TBL-2021]|nr:MAG: hypothetical protein L6R42_006509 [Xanthoria sp. 1 TBL-2021]
MLYGILDDSLARLSQWFAVVILAWYILTIFRRLYFHPLAQVPGPRFAAATLLYQTYYSFAGGRSRFYQKIAKLHQEYGPIVRIAPHEVHLSDPENYDKIYHVGSKFSKDAQFYGGFANPNSMFTTPSNELHRTRRGDLNPFFSRKVVFDHEHMVQEKVNILMGRIEEALESNSDLDVHHGLRAVSIDVITDYAFGESYHLLDQPDLGLQFFDLVQRLGPAAWIFRQWPWLKPIVMMMPKQVAYFLSKPIGFVRDLQSHCKQQIDQLIETRSTMLADKDRAVERPTIFTSLLPTTGIPDELTKTVVGDEAYTVLTAAADTTGNAMTTMTHYVLSDSKIYERLHVELKTAFPSNEAILDYATLEKLPYLTVVSMSSWVLHHDPAYFPDPFEFKPDRWADAKKAQKLEKAFVPFGKGSRACLGMK